MSLNNPESKLKDLIVVEKGLIPKDICDHVIQTIEKRDWAPHTWYNAQAGTFGSEATMELDVQNTTEELQALLTPYVIQAGASYNEKAHYNCERTKQIMYKFSKIRFNRYSPGQIMRKHHDHIASLFSPPEQGIPVLSFIGNLNDDYGGADLVFWDDYTVPLGKGDIIMFPSLFLYPHAVTEATKNRRYSFVSWGW
jgi:predicted 2-oxoglutarate/Fe(II)-dependent dioxygenase YbiX